MTYAHNSGIRRRIYGKSALYMPYCPLMDCYFYTSTNGERQWAVYASWFFYIISINGLLLLHFCKWRNGHVAVYASWFSSLSPLMDCYFYTSANGEWAGSRIHLIVFLPCLLWWIATSTLLQMENGHVAVYDLCFFFIVSINGLLLIHFCKWRMGR